MRLAVLVVILVVLAGCGGFFTDEDAGTVSPAPLPTDATYPPGIGPDGVTSVRVLAATHASQLNDTSFTLVTNRTVRGANGSLLSTLGMTLKLTASRNYAASVTVRGPDAPVFLGEPPTEAEYWANGDVYLRRQMIDNRTEYSRYGRSEDYVGTWRFWLGTVGLDIDPESDLAATLRSFRTGVVDDRRAADSTVHLVGTTVLSTEFVDDQADVRSVTDATLHLFVTESGFVRSYAVVYTAESNDGEIVRVRRTVRYRNVGTTTVGQPPWYDEAMDDG